MIAQTTDLWFFAAFAKAAPIKGEHLFLKARQAHRAIPDECRGVYSYTTVVIDQLETFCLFTVTTYRQSMVTWYIDVTKRQRVDLS